MTLKKVQQKRPGEDAGFEFLRCPEEECKSRVERWDGAWINVKNDEGGDEWKPVAGKHWREKHGHSRALVPCTEDGEELPDVNYLSQYQASEYVKKHQRLYMM